MCLWTWLGVVPGNNSFFPLEWAHCIMDVLKSTTILFLILFYSFLFVCLSAIFSGRPFRSVTVVSCTFHSNLSAECAKRLIFSFDFLHSNTSSIRHSWTDIFPLSSTVGSLKNCNRFFIHLWLPIRFSSWTHLKCKTLPNACSLCLPSFWLVLKSLFIFFLIVFFLKYRISHGQSSLLTTPAD